MNLGTPRLEIKSLTESEPLTFQTLSFWIGCIIRRLLRNCYCRRQGPPNVLTEGGGPILLAV